MPDGGIKRNPLDTETIGRGIENTGIVKRPTHSCISNTSLSAWHFGYLSCTRQHYYSTRYQRNQNTSEHERHCWARVQLPTLSKKHLLHTSVNATQMWRPAHALEWTLCVACFPRQLRTAPQAAPTTIQAHSSRYCKPLASTRTMRTQQSCPSALRGGRRAGT